jgi:hypothetical protein
MLQNERVLVFNENEGMIYYVNKPDKLTNVKNSIIKPKNQSAYIGTSIFSYENGGLVIRYNNKSDESGVDGDVWKFSMATP